MNRISGRGRCLAATLLACFLPAAGARAASLQVSPLVIDNRGTGGASSITLRNASPRTFNAQIRIFRWLQEGGADRLLPTSDVVVSPPITTMRPNTDYVVRVVRVAGQPASREESYRLIVDELPDPGRAAAGTVAMVVRQSIPVFFAPAETAGPRPRWSAALAGGRLRLTLANGGQRRIRVSALSVAAGKTRLTLAQGLAGYALAGSSISWTSALPKGGGGPLKIVAQGDGGPIDATVAIGGR